MNFFRKNDAKNKILLHSSRAPVSMNIFILNVSSPGSAWVAFRLIFFHSSFLPPEWKN